MKSKEIENVEVHITGNPKPQEAIIQTMEEPETGRERNGDRQEFKEDDFVAAMYDGNWFVGKVVDIDRDEREYEITFMEKKKDLYK
jgi:acetolactate synthase small subunit